MLKSELKLKNLSKDRRYWKVIYNITYVNDTGFRL